MKLFEEEGKTLALAPSGIPGDILRSEMVLDFLFRPTRRWARADPHAIRQLIKDIGLELAAFQCSHLWDRL